MAKKEEYKICITNTTAEFIFNYISILASQICNVTIAYFSFIKDEKINVNYITGDVPLFHPCAKNNIHNVVIENDTPTIIENTQLDPKYKELCYNVNNVTFYAGFPLVAKNGSKIGILNVLDERSKILTPEQVKLMLSLAVMATEAIIMEQEKEQKIKLANNELNKIIHDIKNKNTTISLAAEVIESKKNNPKTVKLFTEKIKKNTEIVIRQLNSLIEKYK